MSKNNDKADALIQIAIKKLQKQYGADVIVKLGDNLDRYTVSRWTTGSPDFDAIMGGGIPKGRIIEIFGPEQSGKTSICYMLCAQVPCAVYIDAEGTIDEERARLFGVKDGALLVSRPEYGEEACDMILEFTRANVPLIVVDSVPGLGPKDVVEEKIGKDAVSPIPRLLSKLFMRLMPVLNERDTTIIFINQIREKIGHIGWGDPYTTPGGRALRHYTSLRVQVQRKGWIGSKDARVGQITACRAVKSKVSKPYMACELPLLFDLGFVKHEEVKALTKQLQKQMQAQEEEDIEDEESVEESEL